MGKDKGSGRKRKLNTAAKSSPLSDDNNDNARASKVSARAPEPEEDEMFEDDPVEEEDPEDCDGLDPFVLHFEREMSERLQKFVKQEKPELATHSLDWPVLEKATYLGLKFSSDGEIEVPGNVINISELDSLPPVKVPEPPVLPLKNATLTSLHVKQQLLDNVPLANQVCVMA